MFSVELLTQLVMLLHIGLSDIKVAIGTLDLNLAIMDI